MEAVKIGSGKPANQQGLKLDNGFEKIYPLLVASPDKWFTVSDISRPTALSLKRAIRLSDIGTRTSVSIRTTDKAANLCRVYLRYLPV